MRGDGGLPSIGFVSTYPPTLCGLATFTAALRRAIVDRRGSEEGLGVVRLMEGSRADAKPEVVYEHRSADRLSLRRAIEALSWFDVAIIQHEYGIFGGPDGEEVLDLLSNLEIPAIVTLHTVLSRPSSSQRSILEGVTILVRVQPVTQLRHRPYQHGRQADQHQRELRDHRGVQHAQV